MTTLTLYKGVAFDGVNSFPYISKASTFDTYLLGKQKYSQTINFNRIGEPILINKSYDTAIEYSYGRIDTGSKKYFIIPDSISVNENNRVHLNYSVDWFTTLEYADAITFGRSHLTKSSAVDPKKYPQAISPIDMTISSKTYVGANPTLGEGGMVVAYEKDEYVNFIFSPCKNFMASKVNIDSVTVDTVSPTTIFNGDFFFLTDIKPADVINVWYIPFKTIHGDWTRKNALLTGGKTLAWYESDSWIIGMGIEGSVNTNLTTDNMRKGVITDRNGGIVYVVPYGRTVTKIEYGTALSTTQCFTQLKLTFAGQSSTSSPDKNAENSYVLIPCDNIDYINSTYLNWSMGMKSVEIEERRIQRNKSLTGTTSQAALGGALGAGVAGTAGAVVGTIAGMASGVLSYALDNHYESDVQRLEDQKYKLAQDDIIPGSLIPNDGYTITAYQLSASADDINRYNAEITNFGADCNLPLSSWTPAVGAYKFMDVEVIADVPYSIKENIKRKMQSGIKIVGV